jgi:hypothetical protein
MLEIIMVVALIVLMAKIASIDQRSPLIWGAVTLVFCGASLVIPIPYLRILIAGAVVFVAMIVAKVLAARA